MLDTLLKIGEWQSEGASEWDRFLDTPKVEVKDKKGVEISNFILPIIFDLDEMKVIVNAENLKEYDEERDVSNLKVIKTLPGRNKAVYCSAPFIKLNQIYKTFFGKEGSGTVNEGELFEGLKSGSSKYGDSKLLEILANVFLLKEKFLQLTVDHELPDTEQQLDPKVIHRGFDLGPNQRIVILYACIKGCKFGINEPKPFSEIEDYVSFLSDKFLGEVKEEANERSGTKLCYASGATEKNVEGINLSKRYSLNKMFVTETRNYASFFRKDLFNINYQVGKENQEKLDYASAFLLQNYKVKIAGLDHVVIPQFLSHDNLDLALILDGIKKETDILFSFDTLANMVDEVRIETENIFWINFIAFESDGNFFKSTEIIKDVSRFHFQKVIRAFSDVHWAFEANSLFVNWSSVMSYGESARLFNLNSVYTLIPLRKEKEKKNSALDLFKAILENRKINKNQLYKHFCELILCHYYGRYSSYTNVPTSSKDYFGKSVRDSVFKYHAFLQVLRKLQLIDMETDNQNLAIAGPPSNKYDEAIENFFVSMKLNENQKAMFFLGRMLNTVANQLQKGKNKTAIDKVNFNGMDRDDIVRLRVDLFEKAKQYSETRKIIFTDARFSEYFSFEQWDMDANEAVFFLLTGFSFGARSGAPKNDQNSINE